MDMVNNTDMVIIDTTYRTEWSLDSALALIRSIQPELHTRKYHVALGGGVLNKGVSYKDLDLYMFPFNGAETIEPLLPYLESIWGVAEDIGSDKEGYPPDINFQVRVKFHVGPGRIDVFITKNGVR